MEYKAVIDDIDKYLSEGKIIKSIKMNYAYYSKIWEINNCNPIIFEHVLSIHNIKFILDYNVKGYKIIIK